MNNYNAIFIEYNNIKDFINSKNKFNSKLPDLNETDKLDFLINWAKKSQLANLILLDNVKETSAIDEETQKLINIDNLNNFIDQNTNLRWFPALLEQSYNDWLNLKNVQICAFAHRDKDVIEIDKEKQQTDFILNVFKDSIKDGVTGWHKWCESFFLMPTSLATGKNYKGINAFMLMAKMHNGSAREKLDEEGKPIFKKDKDGNRIPFIRNGAQVYDKYKNIVYEKEIIFEPYTDQRWITAKNSVDYGGLKEGSKGAFVVNPLFQDVLIINNKEKLQCRLPTFKDLNKENKDKKTKISLVEFQIEKIEIFIKKFFPTKVKEFYKAISDFENFQNKNISNFAKLLEKNLNIKAKIYPNKIGEVAHTVFNVGDLINPPANPELNKIKTHKFDENQLNPQAEKLINQFEKEKRIFHNNINSACFCVDDSIYLPPRDQFFDVNGYYSTVFHEMIHSTGSALKRNINNKFGSELYAKEELVAEFGALLLGAQLGIKYDNKNHTSYILSWGKKAFGNDENFKQENPNDLIDIWNEMELKSEDFKQILNDAVKASDYIIKMLETPERTKIKVRDEIENER